MKLIIFGATGFVGQEVLRQALALPAITSIVSVGRHAVPESETSSKVKNVVLSDWLKYTDDVKKELVDADACIWTVGVKPMYLKGMSSEEARKICLDYTLAALHALAAEPRKSPMRFIYVSGSPAVRKVEDKPPVLGDYCVMRGEVETQIIAYEAVHSDRIKAFIVKPGFIHPAGTSAEVIEASPNPFISLTEAAASTLALAVDGSDQQTLLNADMDDVGAAFLAKHGFHCPS